MPDFQVSPSSLRRGSAQLGQLGDDLSGKAQRFLAEVSDASVLGNRDVLGAVAMPIYQGMYDYLAECLATVPEALGGHARQLAGAADDYEATEESNVALANEIIGSL